MTSRNKNARIAGLLYLLLAITGGFGIMYVPTSILIIGDATTTAKNILNNNFMYRLSIFSSLFGQVIQLFLALRLAQLFKDVDETQTKYLLTFVWVAVPIAFINVLNLLAAQILVSGSDYLPGFETNQLNSMAMVFINLYNKGLTIVGIFWGLWLFPFGMLIIKSNFIPKVIGVLLIVGGFTYVVDSSFTILFPEIRAVFAPFITIPLALGEFSTVLRLLIKGAKEN